MKLTHSSFEHPLFLGFVRVRKTGSTSMLNVFSHAFIPACNQTEINKKPPNALDTIPGFYDPRIPLRSNNKDYCYVGHNTERQHFPSIMHSVRPGDGSCPHRQYRDLIEHFWNSSLPYVHRKYERPHLQMFTMIRNPFDRLVSLFDFVVAIDPRWKSGFTDEQYECVEHRDIQCWFARLHPEGRRIPSIAMQLTQFAPDLPNALELMQPQTPTSRPPLVALINECFEASMLLLIDLAPDAFPDNARDAVELFMKNEREIHQNTNKKEHEDLGQWRRKAEEELVAEDFIFYRESVKQFQAMLAELNVDQQRVDECNARLETSL